ncbi:MAG TPA: decaprenyl-phosphate phosphoribosyltransferase [Ktedonobacteraceae bacterium]|nr:decaprenyl-phosphate phosphoribosyltransferase [Ktedonobacteraceae bacterium]
MNKSGTTQNKQIQEQTLHLPEPPIVTPHPPRILDQFRALLVAMRPRQWTKNVIVFIGVVFAQRIFNILAFERAMFAFVVFCLASSCVYLLNDLHDLENDRMHPTKRFRPLASGALLKEWAKIAIGVLLIADFAIVALIFLLPLPGPNDLFARLGGANILFVLALAAYLVLMVLYTSRLKHVVLIDVFIIASGFVLRILAGAVVIPVAISPWLYCVACFLSLFLALSKRRHELLLLQEQASTHRQILKEYSIPMLDQMITIVAAGTVMSYSLYTFQGPAGHDGMSITIPFVLYGIFRYLYLMYMRMQGGSPEEVLLSDRHMLATVMLCTICILLVLYALPQ